MPFWKTQSDDSGGTGDRREYTKHDADYWNQPSLADLIQTYLNGASASYGELREWAAENGYSRDTFYHAINDLKSDGAIVKDGGIVSASDGLSDWG